MCHIELNVTSYEIKYDEYIYAWFADRLSCGDSGALTKEIDLQWHPI